MVNAPLVMPEIITGITQLLLFVSMVQLFAWPHRGFTTIVDLAHHLLYGLCDRHGSSRGLRRRTARSRKRRWTSARARRAPSGR